MRFTFLGTGTSAGIPAIGCTCAVCASTDPHDTRLRTSAAIQWTDPGGTPRTVLIDASPDLRQQSLRAGLTACDAVLFTHNHVDHTFGLDEVRRFNVLMKRPIDIYADEKTLTHLRRVYPHIFERDANVNDSLVATLIAHRVEPGRPIDLHGVRFTPIPLLHGKLPVLGYRIEWVDRRSAAVSAPVPAEETAAERRSTPILPLADCTDVSGIPPESWTHLRGLGTLVLDALRHRHHPTHLTLGRAVGIAHEAAAAQTFFVHMAHDLPHAQTDADLPAGMRLAYDGLVLDSTLR